MGRMHAIGKVGGILGLLFLGGHGGCLPGAGAAEVPSLALTNVAQFYRAAGTGYHANYALELEGVVCWVDAAGSTLVLEDDSGAVPVRGDFAGVKVRVGQRVRLEGNGSAERSGLALAMTQALVVDNDGLHPPTEQSGSAWLQAGLNPIRMLWFNSRGGAVLKMRYQGPGVPWQAPSGATLLHSEGLLGDGTPQLAGGLNYRCWEGEWDYVPDFSQLVAVTNGVAAGFDVSVATRMERVGIEFAGFLRVPQGGLFTFATESDDGSLLYVGPPSLRLKVLGETVVPPPLRLTTGRVLSEGEEYHRCEVEGEVKLVEVRQRTLRLELAPGESPLVMEVVDARGADARLLRGRRVRAVGICHGVATFEGRKVAGYLWVPSWSEIRLLPDAPSGAPASEGGELPLLTTIGQVRRLSREAADRAYPVKVRAVVTAKFEDGANLVVQDADQGIFVRVPIGRTRGRLEVGDACELTGTTRSAAWAPTIEAQRVIRLGLGRLPEPLRPSWDQILNGSLDSQYVELEGIVTQVHEAGVKLLTRVGRIEMDFGGKSREEWQAFEGALVRVRGCVLAVYDPAARVATSGKIRFVHPIIAVDRFPPSEPFEEPLKRVAGLRAFDPQASAFQPVRVSGRVVYAHNDLCCLMDDTNGLRFFPKQGAPPLVGAVVEVVGLVDLSGPSPALREAVIRQLSSGKLPEPEALSGTNLLSGTRDATLVRLESVLLSVNREGADQVLELRTGPRVHAARLSVGLGLLESIPLGSRLGLTGVYLGKGGNWAMGQDIEDFDLALNSPADVTVLERPSWWTPRRLLGLVGSLASVLLLALGWIRVLRRQVEERTSELARQIVARQRVEQQRALEQERARLARDLHDDLGGGLTEISLLGSLAGDRAIVPEQKAGYLIQMTEKARQLTGALDEIVWAVNPRYDSLASLAGYFSLYAQRFLGLASLTCRLEVADDLPERELDSRMRHSLFLAFKEALNNVVRHAQASEVRVRIAEEDDELIVSVADNGRGLEPGLVTTSGMDGLDNMRARLSALGGRCELQGAPTQGATVRLRVPLAKNTHDQSRPG
jgi:signal transduction histidine kinase